MGIRGGTESRIDRGMDFMIENKQTGMGLDGAALKVADEISSYLAQRNGAADTFEGLVSWWLLRQRLMDAESTVRQAVEYLCANGVIRKHQLVDGSVLYMAAPTAANTDEESVRRQEQGVLKAKHSKRR